jgi:hypothetical protein
MVSSWQNTLQLLWENWKIFYRGASLPIWVPAVLRFKWYWKSAAAGCRREQESKNCTAVLSLPIDKHSKLQGWLTMSIWENFSNCQTPRKRSAAYHGRQFHEDLTVSMKSVGKFWELNCSSKMLYQYPVTVGLHPQWNNTQYLCIIVHFTDDNYTYSKYLLDFVTTTAGHTGVVLGNAVFKVLQDYGIEKKLLSISTRVKGSYEKFVTTRVQWWHCSN